MPEQLPDEVWEVGSVEDPGITLGEPMSEEEFPRIIEIVEFYEPGQIIANSIGNYLA